MEGIGEFGADHGEIFLHELDDLFPPVWIGANVGHVG